MVDGIVELGWRAHGMRRLRELAVTKLRGGAFLEGSHAYEITSAGLEVYPRADVRFGRGTASRAPTDAVLGFGIEGLDAMLSGGVAQGSTTTILGPSGSGKTVLGIHFLQAGVDRRVPGLYFGLFEDDRTISALSDRSLIHVWRPSVERRLDKLAHELFAAVDRTGAQRLFLDGLEGLRDDGGDDRLPAFFGAVTQELRRRGVTTVISAETMPGVSAIIDNVLLVRQLEVGSKLVRQLSVTKTRDRAHDRASVEFDIGPSGITTRPRLGAG
jgi:circadian clock protein KaiC